MTKLLSRLTRVAHAAFGAVAALAALALWGWAIDVPALRDLGADFAPMSAAAALGFLLLAVSFLASERGRWRSAYVAAGLAVLISLAALVEHYFALELNVRTAPAAAVTLLLAAA
jgi:hypothetical protein